MTTEIAIQQDATNPVTEATEVNTDQIETGTASSPREIAMAQIEEQLMRQREIECGELPAATQTETAPVITDPQPAERLLKVKIDGVEKELPESEVIKGYQKESAASRRLEEAAIRLREVEERERQLRESTTAQPAETGSSNDAAELAREIIEGFVEGDFEAAQEKLAKALSSRQTDATPVADESKFAEIVARTLAEQEYDRDFAKAKEMFDTTYADINANPRLSTLCNNIYFEQINAGLKPSEAAKIAGEEVRSLFAPAPQAVNSREIRKQGIDTLKPVAAHIPALLQADNAPNDPNAVIADMKRARGQT